MLVHTLPSAFRALLSCLVLCTTASAFQVSPSSPCSPQCTIDGALNTNSTEIVCSDPDFSTTSTGLKFKNCIECLQTSRYFSGPDSDANWFVYNLRFAADVCLFRYPQPNPGNETSPCNVEYVCNPLQKALETDKLSTATGNELAYCIADSSAFRGQSRTTCIGCLQGSPSNKYLSNFLIALEAGCAQQLVPGKSLGLSGSLFSQEAINITAGETHASNAGNTNSKPHLSVGATAGIAVGAAVLFLIGIALLLLYYCRQRRYNKEDRARRASYASYLGYPTYPLYPGENTEIALQGPSYTMDHKSPVQDVMSTDGASESSYNKGGGALQSHPSIHSRQLSQDELQKSTSAMPIHPAYVPRAVMRQNSPGTFTQSQGSSTQHSRNPSFDSPPSIALSAPPVARRPSRALAADSGTVQPSSHSASDSAGSVASFGQRRGRQTPVPLTLTNPSLETDIHHKAVRQLEQHGIYAADQQSQHQKQQPQQHESIQTSPQYHLPQHQQQKQQLQKQQLQKQQLQKQQQTSPVHEPVASFAAGPGPPVTSRHRASSVSSSKSSPSNPNLIQPMPLHATRSSRSGRPQPMHLSLSGSSNNRGSTSSTTPRSQQQRTPPFPQNTPPFQTKRADAPLPGMADIEISGPLAFPDENRFRERGVPEQSGTMGHGIVGPGAARFVAAGGNRAEEQNFIRKGWVAEVPLESDRDDLW